MEVFIALMDVVCSPYFGHSVSFTSEQELYRWLSKMLHAQVHIHAHNHSYLGYIDSPLTDFESFL